MLQQDTPMYIRGATEGAVGPQALRTAIHLAEGIKGHRYLSCITLFAPPLLPKSTSTLFLHQRDHGGIGIVTTQGDSSHFEQAGQQIEWSVLGLPCLRAKAASFVLVQYLPVFLDESEVRKLHHKYGYYLDKCLYQEVSDRIVGQLTCGR